MRKRIVTILIVMLVLMFSVHLCSYASSTTIDSVITQMGEANKLDSADQSTGIFKAIDSVIGIIQFAGSGIAVIVVSILGIKYLFASPSEKADTKKMAIPIIIGCILLFGAVNIAGIIYDFATGAFGK